MKINKTQPSSPIFLTNLSRNTHLIKNKSRLDLKQAFRNLCKYNFWTNSSSLLLKICLNRIWKKILKWQRYSTAAWSLKINSKRNFSKGIIYVRTVELWCWVGHSNGSWKCSRWRHQIREICTCTCSQIWYENLFHFQPGPVFSLHKNYDMRRNIIGSP